MVFALTVFLGIVPFLFFKLGESLRTAAIPPGLLGEFGVRISAFLGAGVFTLGLSVYLFCSVWLMFHGRGPYVEFDPPVRLVASGPYRWVRNPVAASLLVALLGEAVYFRSPGILALWLMVLPLAHYQVTRVEEPRLRRRFGSEYARYCAEVPRWFPRLTPAKRWNNEGQDSPPGI